MGEIIGPEAAMLVAQFARGVSSELHNVESAITENKEKIAPVKLDKQSLIADLTGASPNTPPPTGVDPATEAAIMQFEQQKAMQLTDRRPPFTVGTAPQFAPYPAPGSVRTDSSTDTMLNNIMLTLVSIERQLAMLHKLLKPTSTRNKKANAANGK